MNSYDDEENERENEALPFCGICDSQLIPRVDAHYPQKVWFTCPFCKEAIEHNSDLESLNEAFKKKWLEMEELYNTLQDHLKCLLT